MNGTMERIRGFESNIVSRFTVAFYNPFLKTAWDNKYEVENLHVEESITLDSGEGTLENSVNQMPRPPPRHESYMLSNTLGTDGSGSENYEMAPTRSLNSLNGESAHRANVVGSPPNRSSFDLQKKEIYH